MINAISPSHSASNVKIGSIIECWNKLSIAGIRPCSQFRQDESQEEVTEGVETASEASTGPAHIRGAGVDLVKETVLRFRKSPQPRVQLDCPKIRTS